MKTEEISCNFQEIWKLFKETAERFKETDGKFKETAERFKETDGKFKEAAERFKETEKIVERTSRAVYDLTGKWSMFVEGLIAPAAERMFKERGIELDGISQRVSRHKNGEGIEIDILATNGDFVVLIEAKSTLKIEDVNDHLKRLKKFKSFFPEYKSRTVLGALGGIVIAEGSDKYAYKKGIFVIGESGDTVKILNDKKFKPKKW